MNLDLDLKQREEAKRNAVWDPVARWKAMQAFIAQADPQAEVPRNSIAGCLKAEREKLAYWNSIEQPKPTTERK